MQLTKDASYQRYNALKMQCTKESSHWRCIAPDIHPTRYNLPKMHYMCSAPKLQCTKYEPNRALSSQGFSYTEIQPFGATGATYGQKCLFYGIFGPFLPPLEAPRQFQWVQMAPTDHPGCIPPRSNQDLLRSSHLEPPKLLMAINDRKWPQMA